ncbi:DUF5947 family protein [Streptomyces sp. NPDC002896]|uniref:DUF5947 family protein n=1 Tax=Streptomyces sp. NPDC002896 TaxID=3154438 RepID=UPI00332B5801
MTGAFSSPWLRSLAQRHRFGVPRPAFAEQQGRIGDQERCDLCAEPVPSTHRHLLDVGSDSIACACHACALLFDHKEAGGGHYLRLPDRRRRLDGLDLDDLRWAALGIPVDLAFFVRSGATGAVTARYPNPLGTMRADVDPRTWSEIERSHPELRTMEEDVEALLADRTGSAPRNWLLPLDDCFRLSAVIRTHWKGLGGGPDVHQHIEHFFEDLLTRSGS